MPKKMPDAPASTHVLAKSMVVSGIFFGIGGGGRIWTELTKPQLEEYALAYDRRVIEAVDCPIKLMHICSTTEGNPRRLFEEGWFRNYPVTAVNWAAHSWTPVGLGKRLFGDRFCVVGGLDHEGTLRTGTPEQVEEQVKRAIDDAAEGGGFIIGPGCTVFQDMPYENYNAVGRAVVKYGAYRR